MAKKTSFEIRPDSFDESRLNEASVPAHTDVHNDIDTHKPTHKTTHKQAQVNEPVAKPLKKRRVQLLTYDDLIDEMDAYAAKRGVTRVAVFEVAMRKFLDEVNKK